MFFWSKKKKDTDKMDQNGDNSKQFATHSKSVIVQSAGKITTTTTTTTTTKIQKQIQQGGSLGISKNNPNIFGRYSDGTERNIFTDANKFQTPLQSNLFEPSKFGLQPYKSVYTRSPSTGAFTNNNKPQKTSQLTPSPPRERSYSTSGPSGSVKNKFFNVSLTSLPDKVTEEKKLLINVKKSTKLKKPDDNILGLYDTTSKNRGCVLMINNIAYASAKHYRDGAKYDEENLNELFKQMNFKIYKHTNKKGKEMKNIITSHRKMSALSKYDISFVIVMGHGSGSPDGQATVIMGVDDERVEIQWILEEFNSKNCDGLKDKPKIFIFQCCRGPNEDEVQHDTIKFQEPRVFADMLIAYSTIPGFVSYRNPKSGSWYIEILCKTFMEYACDKDVETMLKIIDKELAKVQIQKLRQTSSFENRGFHKLCFINPGITK